MKRIAIFLDGTWNTLNNNTNVWRLKSLSAPDAEIRWSFTAKALARASARRFAVKSPGIVSITRSCKRLHMAHRGF